MTLAWWALLLGLWSAAEAQWSSDDMTLFDLVEEVNGTFYDFFDVPNDASLQLIKKAYKKLALLHHPDKSSDPEAGDRFRRVAAVYDVLKDAEARERYDRVLVDGLPDWRQPLFYYRNLRKMPWWESLLLVLAIFTAAHYLMLWGAYVDRRLTASQAVEAQVKREQKKLRRKDKGDLDELVEERLSSAAGYLNRPRWTQLLPLKILQGLLALALAAPSLCRAALEALRRKEEAVEEVVEETEEERRARRGVVYTPDIEYEMADGVVPVSTFGAEDTAEKEPPKEKSRLGDGSWAVEEVSTLIRLSSTKFPLGTGNRWEKIAAAMNRSPSEITAMIGKVKKMERSEYERLSKLEGQQLVKSSDAAQALPPKTERVEAETAERAEWSQAEQRALEAALARFPKTTPERWDRVAEAVPGRSPHQCLQRFKHLAALLKSRKAQSQ